MTPLGSIDSLPSPDREMAALMAASQNNSPEVPGCINSARHALQRALEQNKAVQDLIAQFEDITGKKFN